MRRSSSGSRAAISAWPLSEGTTSWWSPAGTRHAWPRPVPAPRMPMGPCGSGRPRASVTTWRDVRYGRPRAFETKSLSSTTRGIPVARASRDSSMRHGRFVTLAAPSRTGPATPNPAAAGTGSPRRKISTTDSRPGYAAARIAFAAHERAAAGADFEDRETGLRSADVPGEDAHRAATLAEVVPAGPRLQARRHGCGLESACRARTRSLSRAKKSPGTGWGRPGGERRRLRFLCSRFGIAIARPIQVQQS